MIVPGSIQDSCRGPGKGLESLRQIRACRRNLSDFGINVCEFAEPADSTESSSQLLLEFVSPHVSPFADFSVQVITILVARFDDGVWIAGIYAR